MDHGKSPSDLQRLPTLLESPWLPKEQLWTLRPVPLQMHRCSLSRRSCLTPNYPQHHFFVILQQLGRQWYIYPHLCQSFERSNQSFQTQNEQTFVPGHWGSLERSEILLVKVELLPKCECHLQPPIHQDLQQVQHLHQSGWTLHHLSSLSLAAKLCQWLFPSFLGAAVDLNPWQSSPAPSHQREEWRRSLCHGLEQQAQLPIGPSARLEDFPHLRHLCRLCLHLCLLFGLLFGLLFVPSHHHPALSHLFDLFHLCPCHSPKGLGASMACKANVCSTCLKNDWLAAGHWSLWLCNTNMVQALYDWVQFNHVKCCVNDASTTVHPKLEVNLESSFKNELWSHVGKELTMLGLDWCCSQQKLVPSNWPAPSSCLVTKWNQCWCVFYSVIIVVDCAPVALYYCWSSDRSNRYIQISPVHPTIQAQLCTVSKNMLWKFVKCCKTATKA